MEDLVGGKDPKGPQEGKFRTRRGGAWAYEESDLDGFYSGRRGRDPADYRGFFQGFRIVATISTNGTTRAAATSLTPSILELSKEYESPQFEGKILRSPYGSSASANAINNAGLVVGSYFEDETMCAVYWTDGVAQELPGSSAVSVSDGGHVTGITLTSPSSCNAMLWRLSHNGAGEGFPSVVSSRQLNGFSTGVNQSGTTIYNVTEGRFTRGYVTSDKGTQQIASLGGTRVFPKAINSADTVVGTIRLSTGELRAFAWGSGNSTDLGSLGGDKSEALAVNKSNTIVGASRDAAGDLRAFIWRSGKMAQIDVLGSHMSAAKGINDDEVVVGTYSDVHGTLRPFWWCDGRLHDLNEISTLPTGLTLVIANAINSSNWIIATGKLDGEEVAVLLRPRPSP